MGYSLGGIDWDSTSIGQALGGHVRAVFTLVTFIFIFCISVTISSFPEVPLSLLEGSPEQFVNENDQILQESQAEGASTYGSLEQEPTEKKVRPKMLIPDPEYSTIPGNSTAETSFGANSIDNVPHPSEEAASLSHYLMSIIFMPHSLRMVCLTNLFCWSAHVCYSLYFTDFVGEAVFMGDPKATEGSEKSILYEEGTFFI